MFFYSFPNIFGIGDCINAPCAKTAAAVGKSKKNLSIAHHLTILLPCFIQPLRPGTSGRT